MHSIFQPGRRVKALIIAAVFLSLVAGGIFILPEHAFFVQWVNLGCPLESPRAGEKVDKILSASHSSVRVGTSYGRAFEIGWTWYERQSPLEKPSEDWREVVYEIENYSQANIGCPYTFWVPPLPRSFGRIVAQAQVRDCRLFVGTFQTIYLVLTDGTVWVWTHEKTTGNW